MDICFASHNANKVAEIRLLLPDRYRLLSLKDLDDTEAIEETAHTLQGNAYLKAQHVWQKYGIPCFADDTGLEVAALGGRPGVHSARYAGEPSDAEANIQLLLHQLDGITDRKARFRTVIALILSQSEKHNFEGIVEGQILHQKQGAGGFGYDPVFLPEGYAESFAQMPLSEKNRISHRGRAFSQLIRFLK
ncbi:MAG: RdgB/HAM1 family non-canonical purine NTP pyrophosphatase [Bernardetiaceae bacterium]